MAPIFQLLGLSVGVLQMAAVTENGKKAFLVDFSKESPHEDQLHLRMVDRVEAYAADVTYGTNSEFGFDYLRDNMTMRLADRVQRGHYYAIVDEVDNVLIDEARTPLIISGPAQGDLEWYGRMSQIVKQLKPEDYDVNEKDRAVSLTEVGMAHVEALLGQTLMDPDRPEDLTPEQARLTGYLEQALRAQQLFHRNKDYLVQGGKVVIVDEFTGSPYARPSLVRRSASGRGGQGRRSRRARERHLRHGDASELLPHVWQTRRDDRHGSHGGGGVQQDL